MGKLGLLGILSLALAACGKTDPAKAKPTAPPPEMRGEVGFDERALGTMEGLIRDERGIRFAPEEAD